MLLTSSAGLVTPHDKLWVFRLGLHDSEPRLSPDSHVIGTHDRQIAMPTGKIQRHLGLLLAGFIVWQGKGC